MSAVQKLHSIREKLESHLAWLQPAIGKIRGFVAEPVPKNSRIWFKRKRYLPRLLGDAWSRSEEVLGRYTPQQPPMIIKDEPEAALVFLRKCESSTQQALNLVRKAVAARTKPSGNSLPTPGAQPVGETAASPGKRKRMSVEEANKEAKKVAKRFGKGFFAMSANKQAEHVGCHHLTWKNTAFYKSAMEKGLITKPKKRVLKAVGLTATLETVIGEGERNEILNQVGDRELHRLIQEQVADFEPSPLEPSPMPERERKVRCRKRV